MGVAARLFNWPPLYINDSDDSAEEVPERTNTNILRSLRFLNIRDKLIPYDAFQHVPSDIAFGQQILPQNAYQSQEMYNQLSA